MEGGDPAMLPLDIHYKHPEGPRYVFSGRERKADPLVLSDRYVDCFGAYCGCVLPGAGAGMDCWLNIMLAKRADCFIVWAKTDFS